MMFTYLSETMDFKGVINKNIGIIDKNLTLKYISSGLVLIVGVQQ